MFFLPYKKTALYTIYYIGCRQDFHAHDEKETNGGRFKTRRGMRGLLGKPMAALHLILLLFISYSYAKIISLSFRMMFPATCEAMTTAEPPEPLTHQHSEFIIFKQILLQIGGPAARHSCPVVSISGSILYLKTHPVYKKCQAGIQKMSGWYTKNVRLACKNACLHRQLSVFSPRRQLGTAFANRRGNEAVSALQRRRRHRK